MKKILTVIFPIFFAEKRKTKSKFKLLMSTMDTVAAIWIILWLTYTTVIYPTTNTKITIDHYPVSVSLPSDTMAVNDIREITDTALNDLRAKGIFIQLPTNVYLSNSRVAYFAHMMPFSQFMALFSPAITMWNVVINSKGIIPSANIHFIVHPKSYENNSTNQEYAKLVEHEFVHVWQMQHYGFIENFKVPTWVQEGYAVYVANNMHQLQKLIRKHYSFKTTKDFITLYLEKNSNFFDHTPPDYLIYGLMIKHAIEDMSIGVDDLHQGKAKYDTVLNSLLDKYGIEYNATK